MIMRRIKNFFFVTLTSFYFIHANCQTLSGNTSFEAADSLYFANDWSSAARLYKQLLKDTSANSVEWQRLGFSYYNLGKPDDALRNFQKAENNNPPATMQPFLYSRMAKVYSIKNDREKTLNYLK